MEKEADKKIIKLNPFKSNIYNSPLLQGKEVEVKDYTEGLNHLRKVNETEPVTQPVTEEKPIVQTPPQPEPVKEKYPDDYQVYPPSDPPPQQYPEDNVEEANFDEKPAEPEPDKSDLMSPAQAKGQAGMMINMYSMFVPPALAKLLKKDVQKVNRVLKFSGVNIDDIRKIEHFLNTKNSEIEKALQLTNEQVMALKEALSAVLEKYKLSPDNPVIQLIILVLGIAFTQYMSVSAIIKSQYEQLKELIEAKNLKAPEGDEDFATPQGFFKKKIKIKTAA